MEQKIKNNKISEMEINGETVYCIEDCVSGKKAVFDHNDRILRSIVSRLRRYKGRFSPNSRGEMMINNSPKRKGMALSRFLYSKYQGININKLKSSKISYINERYVMDGIEDCRSCNLAYNGGVVRDNPSRTIKVTPDGKYIEIYLKRQKTTERLEYHSVLYDILATPNICSFFVGSGCRTMVRVYRGKNYTTLYLSRLVYVFHNFYEDGMAVDTILDKFMALNGECKQELAERVSAPEKRRSEEATIDRVNSDIHNNCMWNLAVMTQSNNSLKRDLVAKIKPPYYAYIAVTDQEEYRITFGYMNEFHWGQELHILCRNDDRLIDFLRCVTAMKDVPAFMRRYGSPKEVYSQNKSAPYFAGDFRKAERYAEKLLAMAYSEFLIWDVGSKLLVRR